MIEKEVRSRKEHKKAAEELKWFIIFAVGLFWIAISLAAFMHIDTYAEEIIAEINTKEEGIYDPNLGVYIIGVSSAPGNVTTDDNISNPEATDNNTELADSPHARDEGGSSGPGESGGSEGTVNVYIPDSDDDCPVNEQVPISVELQEYLWTRCKKACPDAPKDYYAFCLGVMQHESTFRPKATHKNSNGSVDRGIMQINSSNIKKMIKAGYISSSDDLFDPEKCIDCGLHMLNNYISKFGISESAYYAYNTGREREGSNKNSRIVWGYYQNWKEVLYES